MTQLAPVAPDLRRTLRRPGDALPGASIGTVPILWNNVDIVELRLGTDAATLLDEIARTCLLYTSPSPRDLSTSRMPSSA